MPGNARGALTSKALIACLVAGVFLFSVALPLTRGADKKLPASPPPGKKPAAKSSTARKPAVKSRKKTATRKTSAKSRRARKQPFRYRLARLKLQPDRISEIQGALTRAGYLDQEPNGKWDDATRGAMRRFQQEHGFPTTGLPEAKSLMKLGLGPHPLPEELDSTAQANQPGAPLDGAESADPPPAPEAQQ
ncbi:MAG: peptidoglycan-binding protein [Terriglobia bacterium]